MNAPKPGKGRLAGFTLVELLVVVAIIALLVSILLPSLSKARELARRTVCETNLHALGRGWQMYWAQNNYRTYNQFNGRPDVPDCISQFDFLMWCRAGAGGPCWVNSGVLYKTKCISSEGLWVCPTIRGSGPMIGLRNRAEQVDGFWDPATNPWPVTTNQTVHGKTSYGTRQMQCYDDRTLAVEQGRPDHRTDNIMIWKTGVEKIAHPANFSFQADGFDSPEIALLSHVPGVNVQYLDGHVKFYEDPIGDVLYYGNGIAGWGDADSSWRHDDIWMVIDGYHHHPVGTGS